MICPHCNAAMEGNNTVCLVCGAQLQIQSPEQSSRQKNKRQPQNPRTQAPPTCPYCNGTVARESAYCMTCGARLSDPCPKDTCQSPAWKKTYATPLQPASLAIEPKSTGKGMAALVLALVSFLIPCVAPICGILAIIFAALEIRHANQYASNGKGMAIAGLIIGILSLAFFLFYVGILVFMA